MRRRNRLLARLVLAFVPALAGAGELTGDGEYSNVVPVLGNEPCDGEFIERFLEIVVNDTTPDEPLILLQRPCGAVFAPVDELERLRIITGGRPTVTIDDAQYLNLNTLPGLKFNIEYAPQTIVMEGEPWVFYPTVIDAESERRSSLTKPASGVFLNYGLFTGGTFGDSDRAYQGFATVGLFNRLGTLTSDHLAIQSAGADPIQYRLATTFFRDFPDRISGLRIGDVITRVGVSGSSQSVGGIQYGTNFATRPGLTTTPIQMIELATRRTAAVRVLNRGIGGSDGDSIGAIMGGVGGIPHGPVEIKNLPTFLNGRYEVTLRDSLGREFTTTRTHFFNLGLLRQGLHDFSYTVGARRESLINDNYSDLVISGLHRYGFNRWFTGELAAQTLDDRYVAGFTGLTSVPWIGVVETSIAGLESDTESGEYLAAIGIENRYRRFGYVLRLERRSDAWQPLGNEPGPNDVRHSWFASASRALPWGDSIAASIAGIERDTDPDARNIQASYNSRPLPGVVVNMFGNYRIAPTVDYSFGAFVNLNLDAVRRIFSPRGNRYAPRRRAQRGLFDPRRSQLSLQAFDSKNGDLDAQARISTGFNRDSHAVGLRLTKSLAGREFASIQASAVNHIAVATVDVSEFAGEEVFSAGVSSGLIYIEGRVFPTQPVATSFGLVRLGKENANIRVNGIRTDSRGDAFVYPLQPYIPNTVAINGTDLPLNARAEQFTFTATPRFRNGVLIEPEIRLVRDAIILVELRDDTGATRPLPPGSWARVPGENEDFATGLDGAIYLTGLDDHNRIQVFFKRRECTIEFSLPENLVQDDIPELGPFICEEATQ